MKIRHDSRDIAYRKPFGAVSIGSEIYIAIDIADNGTEKTAKGDGSLARAQEDRPPALFEPRVRLMVWEGEALSPRYYDMTEDPRVGRGSDLLRYSATFRAPDKGVLLWYAFEIVNGDESVYYGNNKRALGGIGEIYEASPECYQITVYKPAAVPKWYKDGIVYQIFPDRFCRDEGWKERTEAANERVNTRRSDIKRTAVDDWYMPAYYGRDEEDNVIEWPFYGGSFKGIESKLDYLSSFGVKCIYLNPIFEAVSNHRYDTADYMHTDPALGTDEECGSNDLPHYFAKVDHAPYTFTPDADYPLINIEKGHFTGIIRGKYEEREEKPRLLLLDSGVKTNVIPARAEAVIEGSIFDEVSSVAARVQALTKIGFTVIRIENDKVKIVAEGRQGHAASPQTGNNALTAMLALLNTLELSYSEGQKMINSLAHLFPHGDWLGRAAGVAMSDDVSGDLIMSLNILHYTPSGLYAEFDSRTCVTATPQQLDVVRLNIEAAGMTLESLSTRQSPGFKYSNIS